MVILYVDASQDDAFFFARFLKETAPGTEWRHVRTIQDAKCYLEGEGPYQDRKQYPFPQLVIADSKLPDGTAQELLEWARSQPEFARIPFCLFNSFGQHFLSGDLPLNTCVFEKPSQLSGWPATIKQMLQWLSQQQT